jgi:hypothetical protein
LKHVVLPAPLGPISPVIAPSATSNETSLRAVIPPNRIVRLRTSSKDATRYFSAIVIIVRVSTSSPVGDQPVPSHFAAISCVIG